MAAILSRGDELYKTMACPNVWCQSYQTDSLSVNSAEQTSARCNTNSLFPLGDVCDNNFLISSQ